MKKKSLFREKTAPSRDTLVTDAQQIKNCWKVDDWAAPYDPPAGKILFLCVFMRVCMRV